jgi:small neutral amino acid transporter SnatA (MarC family)
MSIAIRIMGLLLAAVAIQFMLNAIKVFRLDLISPPPM